MNRSVFFVLPVVAMGYVGVAGSSNSAIAGPWGHSEYGTNIHAGNCDCNLPAAAPQQAAQQAPTTMAKQTNPGALQNEGPPATKQR